MRSFVQDNRRRKGESFPRVCRALARRQNLVGAGRGSLANVKAFRFMPKKGGDAVNDLIQWGTGAEAGEGMELLDRGHAAHHVLKAGFVGLVVGHVLNGKIGRASW